MVSNNSWDAYNEFLLHGTLDRFTKILARYELFKRVVDIPGDIVECGVFKGTGVLFWAKMIQIFNPLSARRVVGFDTFDGFPEDTTTGYEKRSGDEFVLESSYESVSPESIMEIAKSQGLENRVELVKGDATHTIKDYIEKNPGFRVALLNLDFDVYSPTAASLHGLYPLVVPGGVVAFDEYAARGWGESDAADEYLKDLGVTYKSIPWALSPTAYFVKQH